MHVTQAYGPHTPKPLAHGLWFYDSFGHFFHLPTSLYISNPSSRLLHQTQILLSSSVPLLTGFTFLSYRKQSKQCFKKNHMSSASKAWIVATSVGVVEALKDQGVCRWNSALRSAQQHLKNQARSVSQAKNHSPPPSAMISNRLKDEKAKQSQESLRTVMYLSCWGPN